MAGFGCPPRLKPRDEVTGPRVYLDVEQQRIQRVVRKVALGCYVLRYKKVPPLSVINPVALYPYNIHDSRPIWIVMAGAARLRPKPWTHVQRGVFSYTVVRIGAEFFLVLDFQECLLAVVGVPNPRASMQLAESPQMALAFDGSNQS